MYKVTVYFKNGATIVKYISGYNYACVYSTNVWKELDDVIKTELKEVKHGKI